MRCLGRTLILLAIIAGVPYLYFRMTPAGEYLRARAYQRVGQYDQAIRWYRRGLERHPNSGMNTAARFDLGECLFQSQHYEDAAVQYRKALAQAPHDERAPEAQMNLGRCLIALHKDAKAIAELKQVRQRYPDRPDLVGEAEYLTAKLYFDRRQWPEAVSHARYVVDQFPTSTWAPQCQLLIGDALRAKGASDRAIDAYRKVVENYSGTKESAAAQLHIAEIRYDQKRYHDALDEFKTALAVATKAKGSLLNGELLTKITAEINKLTGLIGSGGK